MKSANAAIMSAVVLLASGAHAAGLGKLTVLSSLGQPLRAEIELTSVSKEEAGSLTARLAPMEAYRQANIDFNPALQSLQFSIEQRNGRQYIRLTSSQPINEPFVDMLLELGTNNSRLMREYTFLLDPADVRTTQPPQTVAPSSPAGLVQPSRSTAPASAASARLAAPAPTAQADSASAGPAPAATAPASPAPPRNAASPTAEEYRVRSGDSLAKIAAQVKPDAVSLDQMLVSLFNANPDAFAGRNMNRLRAGEILKVPDARTAGAVSTQEARQIIRAQAADFSAYRNRLAGQVAASAAKKSVQDAQSATGKITSSVDESASSVDAAQDKLKLSRAGATGAADSATGPGSASSEELVAKDKALSEANDRVRELEKNLADLQTLLQIKSKELTERQQQAEAANGVARNDAGQSPSEQARMGQDPSAGPGQSGAAAPSAQAAQGSVAVADSTAAEKTVAAPTTIPQSPSPDALKPPAAAASAAKSSAPAAETSFFDELLASPMLLPAAGFLTLALGAFGVYHRRRQKPASKAADTAIGSSGLKANSLFAATGGQSVDTSNSVFNSSFSPSASQLDANEVDPVAEADVYIAYGRDAQAEEILREALRGQPERHAVRLKLLEIYAGRKDLRAFETHATELYGQTKGEGDEWQQALRLGRGIDPKNPLYGGTRDTSDIDSKIADAEAIMGTDIDTVTPPGTEDADSPPQAGPLTEAADPEPSRAVAGALGDGKDDTPDTSGAVSADLLPPLELAVSKPMQADQQAADSGETPQSELAGEPAREDVSKPAAESTASFGEQLNSLAFELGNFPAGSVADDKKSSQIEATESITIDSLDFDLDGPAADKKAGQPDLADDVPVLTATAFEQPKPYRDDRTDGSSLANADAASSSPAMGDMMDFDLSGIDLELPGKEAQSSLDADISPANPATDAATNPEMATKLDLAAAYQEIGDKEGARELLDEVVQGGTPSQVAEARRMLEKLT